MAEIRTQNSPSPNAPVTTTKRNDRPQSSSLTRRDPFGAYLSPFTSMFRRWNDEMDRLFEDFGVGQSRTGSQVGLNQWSPQVEITERGNDLIVRADLPGLKKEDVQVDIADDVLTIQGERRQEHEEEKEGWRHTERSYGSFYRAIPLPEGTITDSAKATFKDGVLEVVLQAPPREVSRGRRLEIK